LYLKKVEMQGFKSFADRVEIEFQPGVNAIIGPNGSGKSNIMDAIKWVLGEQSIRNLRGLKLEDVIFAGSTIKRPMGMAEVSIILDNTDNLIPLEYSEVSFTRRAFRSGESEFYLNKVPCRLKDIQEILMDTGIGKDGYSIIGQGQIDEVLKGRPEERRLILEEAAGIVKHKYRKHESEKRLEETVSNISRIDDILNEIKNQLDPLYAQKQTALEYRALSSKYKQIEIDLLLFELSQRISCLSDIRKSMEDYNKKLQEILTEKRIIFKRLEDNKSKLKQEQEQYEKLREEKYSAISEKKELQKDLKWISEEIQRLKKENDEINNKMDVLKKNLISNQEVLSEKKLIHVKKINSINDFEIEILKNEKKLEHIEGLLKKKEDEIEHLKVEVIDLLNFGSEKKNLISSLNAMEQNLQKRAEQIEKEIIQLDEANNKTCNEIKSIKEKLAQKRLDFIQHEDIESKLQQSIKELTSDFTESSKLLAKSYEELSTVTSRYETLNEISESYDGYQFGVKNLFSHIKNRKFKADGIYGTVADLINVQKRYEIAIETALGGALQNIVCNDDEDAKNAINYMKSRDLGRATFLPLNTIKPRNLNANEAFIVNIPGCSGTAEHLITFDKKFSPIFSNLLGRVLIVDNLNNAISIAKKSGFNLKIVTLDGQVINPGGSITGGSQRKSNFILSRKRQINEYKQEMNTIKKLLSEIKYRNNELKASLSEKQNSLDEEKAMIYNIKLELAALDNQLHEKQNFINERLQRKKQLEQEKQQIKEETLNIKEEIRTLNVDISDIDGKNLNSQSMAKEMQEQVVKLKDQKQLFENKITETRVHLASTKQEEINIKQSIEDIKQKIASIYSELAFCENKLKQNTHDISSSQDKTTYLKDKIDSISKLQEKLSNDIDNLTNQKQIRNKQIEDDQNKLANLEQDQKKVERQENNIEVKETKIQMEIKQIGEKLHEKYLIRIEDAVQLEKKLEPDKIDDMKRELNVLKDKIASLGNVNLQAIDDYDNLKSRYDFLNYQREDLVSAKEKLIKLIDKIITTMEEMFIETFEKVREEFLKVFNELFDGGKADLLITKEQGQSVLDAGIDIVAQPPGKKLQNISLLSGGEKALTAIALLFAILNIKSTPFCVLDEIDAALDEANTVRFTKYLRKACKYTQFIIITHRRSTMEVADALYGISMEQSAVSKVLTLKVE